jgi:hypothetical protein
MKKASWLLLVTLLSSALWNAPTLFAQATSAPAAPGDENAAVDELVRILVEKGLLKPEEAAAMLRRKGEAGFFPLTALTEILKSKGLLTSEEAARIGQAQAGRPPAAVPAEPKKEDREKMKAEIKEEAVKEAKTAVPEWVKRIRFGGDIRLRYQGDFFDENNADFVKPSDPSQLLNSKEDRNRFRVRARLGATAKVNDQIEAGLRLSTGTTSDPVSNNQTMGNYFNNYTVVFDRAYVKVNPFSRLTLWGGRFANPWFHSYLVWDPDVAFDGFAADWRGPFLKSLSGFATAGAFPLQELEFTQHDKWLFGGQAGLEFKPKKWMTGKLGVAYYDYRNTQGEPNDPARPGEKDYTAPQFQQKGNTLFDIDPSAGLKLALASEYRELNVTATLDFAFWDPVRIQFVGDYVKNLAFDRAEVASLTGNPDVKESTEGYLLGLSVGYPRARAWKQWRSFLEYRYLEADAVLDAFTDSDFHLGGTNAQGWVLGGEFGLARNVWTSIKWVTSNEIEGPPFSVDSLFIDLNASF